MCYRNQPWTSLNNKRTANAGFGHTNMVSLLATHDKALRFKDLDEFLVMDRNNLVLRHLEGTML